MGVLMMVGISVSNSVLVVEFANRQRETPAWARCAADPHGARASGCGRS